MNINDLTYQLNGAIFEVSRILGAGFLEEAQILSYLKATEIQVGLLVNFRHPKAEIKHMVLGLDGAHCRKVGIYLYYSVAQGCRLRLADFAKVAAGYDG